MSALVSIRLHVGVARQVSGTRSVVWLVVCFNPSSRRSSPSGGPGSNREEPHLPVSIRLHVGVARQARYASGSSRRG